MWNKSEFESNLTSVIKESISGWEQRTHRTFSARSSGSECEHNTEKRQDGLQAFGTGDYFPVTKYSWNPYSFPSLCACSTLLTSLSSTWAQPTPKLNISFHHFAISVFSWKWTPLRKKLSFFVFMLHLLCTRHGIYEHIQVTKVWKQPTDSYIPWCKEDRQLLGTPGQSMMGCWPTHESMNKAREIFNIYFWRPVGLDCRSPTGMGKTETSLLTGANEASCTLRWSWDEGQNTTVC